MGMMRFQVGLWLCEDILLGVVFANEVKKLREERIRPKEQLTLEPFERDHAMVVGVYQRSQTG